MWPFMLFTFSQSADRSCVQHERRLLISHHYSHINAGWDKAALFRQMKAGVYVRYVLLSCSIDNEDLSWHG